MEIVTRRRALAIIVLIGLAFASGEVLGSYVTSQGHAAAAAPAHPDPVPESYLYLTIATDPVTGYDAYLPANFTVPAHTLIHVVITNYDNGTNPVPDAFAHVSGTVGGTERVGDGPDLAGVPAGTVSHTFSIDAGPYAGLNVPVPAAADGSHPTIVSFTMEFDAPGVYLWWCHAPCDDNAMGHTGLMGGTITVVGA